MSYRREKDLLRPSIPLYEPPGCHDRDRRNLLRQILRTLVRFADHASPLRRRPQKFVETNSACFWAKEIDTLAVKLATGDREGTMWDGKVPFDPRG